MAKDIKVVWDNVLLQGDVSLNIGDLETDETFETAVLMSLFTHRRVDSDEELLDDPNDRKGWWGDQYAEIDTDEIGSKLWLLARAKTEEKTLEKAKQYAYEALEWMLEDGVASEIIVVVERQGKPGNDRLAFKVQIFKEYDGDVAEEYNFVWNKQFGLT